MLAPGQVYSHKGRVCFYVRSEARSIRGGDEAQIEHLIASVEHGNVNYFWTPKLGDQYELVSDPLGRKEAEEMKIIAEKLESERDILFEVLKKATKMLPKKQAEELRSLYKAKTKDLDIIES